MISSFTRSDKFDYPTFRTGYLFPGHFISDGKDAQVNGLYVCVCLGVGSGGGVNRLSCVVDWLKQLLGKHSCYSVVVPLKLLWKILHKGHTFFCFV